MRWFLSSSLLALRLIHNARTRTLTYDSKLTFRCLLCLSNSGIRAMDLSTFRIRFWLSAPLLAWLILC